MAVGGRATTLALQLALRLKLEVLRVLVDQDWVFLLNCERLLHDSHIIQASLPERV